MSSKGKTVLLLFFAIILVSLWMMDLMMISSHLIFIYIYCFMDMIYTDEMFSP